ncbi:hypothetical protein F5Y10DRAFT_268656 [Nemania abortiva]|nr:hypothetical protein F5Y10DRAFT_268656 [Nemania abortiva]
MQFKTFILTVLTSLATTTSAMPVAAQENVGMSRAYHVKRVPCPVSSDKSASADYKRATASTLEENEDDIGDDSPGFVIACNF